MNKALIFQFGLRFDSIHSFGVLNLIDKFMKGRERCENIFGEYDLVSHS